jgi:riboflavin kinase/FMN adenylyltransferase
MQVLNSITELADLGKPACLAIGVFDGVHRGHQALVNKLREAAGRLRATPVAVTFDPHPLQVLHPGGAPAVLTPTAHKLRLLERYGIEHTLVIPFTPAFATTPADVFIRELFACAKPLHVIAVGHRWEFGHRRSGNVALLEALGLQLGFDVIELEPVLEDSEPISSTRVRQAVGDGNLAHAAALLGRAYSVFGPVVPGDGLGRQIGIPTANIDTGTGRFPPRGVYAGSCTHQGVTYRSVMNLGIRPTVNGTKPGLEAHLIGFQGDLYNQLLEVEFHLRLRDEARFSSLADLRAQIVRDIAAAT